MSRIPPDRLDKFEESGFTVHRAPPPGDSPVRHLHYFDEDFVVLNDAKNYFLHSHPGGRESHTHSPEAVMKAIAAGAGGGHIP